MRWVACWLLCIGLGAAEPIRWLKGTATKLPSETTNQESGYFSLIDAPNGKLYIGAAKYGVNAYLLEFDPKTRTTKVVVDAMAVIGSTATGFAAQAKFHTRNNVGPSGKVYVATKQGYPEKGEKREDYPGGYPMVYDPATGKTEFYPIPKAQSGIISIAPDEAKGVAYLSTCSDTRPVEQAHFMILDLKKRTYRDLGDMAHLYAFVVVDAQHRAYHPKVGGKVAVFDPDADQLTIKDIVVDGQSVPKELSKPDCIQNWEVTRDRKQLYCVEMTTNELYAFDLTRRDGAFAGKRCGKLLPHVNHTDCRAMTVGHDNTVWAAVSTNDGFGQVTHLVKYGRKDAAPVDLGIVAVANADFTTFTDAAGKPKPWHHTMTKHKDGTLAPWQPMGVCPMPNGDVYVETIAPFTLIHFTKAQLDARSLPK